MEICKRLEDHLPTQPKVFNMKKTLFFLLLGILFYGTGQTYAQTKQPSVDQQFIERVASRVAQMKLVARRGVVGTVTAVSDTQITLSDLDGNTRFIDVDELTKFSPPGNGSNVKNYGISDISKGDTLGILGLFNKESDRILARFVDTEPIEMSFYGTVSAKDDNLFVLTIHDESGKDTKVNVDTGTKMYSFTKGGGMVKSGFSKIAIGERILAKGNFDLKDKSLLDANRLFLLPEITQTQQVTPTLTPAQ